MTGNMQVIKLILSFLFCTKCTILYVTIQLESKLSPTLSFHISMFLPYTLIVLMLHSLFHHLLVMQVTLIYIMLVNIVLDSLKSTLETMILHTLRNLYNHLVLKFSLYTKCMEYNSLL